MLVEDSVADAKVFEMTLERISARTKLFWVASGEEALDFLNQRNRFQGLGNVQIVVLDWNLAGLSGLEVLRQIRTHGRFSRLPVIFFTSSKAPADVNQAYANGANGYFTKPMTLEIYAEKLKCIVRCWLDLAELPTFPNS